MFIASKPNQDHFALIGAKQRTEQGMSFGDVARSASSSAASVYKHVAPPGRSQQQR